MFAYTHVLSISQAASSARDGDSHYGQTGLGSISYSAWVFDETRSTSYSYGTQPNSVSSIPFSSTRSFVIYTFDSSTGGFEETFSSATGTLGPRGSSTGVDSFSYTYRPTKTYGFTHTWQGSRDGSITQLTAAGTATTENTTATATGSASGTTLVPIFAIDLPTVQRWYGQRQHPPPLRRVMQAFAPLDDSSQVYLKTIAAGSNRYLSDQKIASTTSSFVATNSISSPIPTPGTTTFSSSAYSTQFSGISASSSVSGVAKISAQRKAFFSNNVLVGTSLGDGISLASSVNGLPLMASIGFNLSSLSVFTSAHVIDSTTFFWRHESSSWVLHARSTSDDTTSTYTIGWSVTGMASSGTENAANGTGRFVNILGPRHPVSLSNFNVISVSTLTNVSGNHVFYTAWPHTTSLPASSFTLAGSSSQEVTIGSGPGIFCTYPASSLTVYSAQPAFTIQTVTWVGGPVQFLDATGIIGASSNPGSIPALSSNSKWNEAGRFDAPSVSQ